MSSRTNSLASIATSADLDALLAWADAYSSLTLDLGAGDGRFARELARNAPERAVIAVDTCEANARRELRRMPENARFVVADAIGLPQPLLTRASLITVNFPWGSLLRALLDESHPLMATIARRSIVVRVNGGALEEAGYDVDTGKTRLLSAMRRAGADASVRTLEASDLRQVPTTWSKRLAFGRDPRAIELRGTPCPRAIAAD